MILQLPISMHSFVAISRLNSDNDVPIKKINNKPVGDMVRSLASMSLCKYRSSAHLLKLTRTSVKLTGKLLCDVARLLSIMIISDDVISDVIRPRSTIREDHIDTPYREILC